MRGTLLSLVGLFACGTPEKNQEEDCADSAKIEAFADADDDGAGDPGTSSSVCTLAAGMVTNGDDCDDGDDRVSPYASETCDGVDEDCDGKIDDGLPDGTWYADLDEDGFGDVNAPRTGCAQPDGAVLDASDCDDGHDDAHPGAPELCDGYDNDCDNDVDDEDVSLDPTGATTWYRDADHDGFGNDASPTVACANPNAALFIDVGGDCDDGDAQNFPGQTEVCDRRDNNCDALIDEDDPLLDWSTAQTFYVDGDLDGAGDAAQPIDACFPAPGRSPSSDDCDDADPLVGAAPYWLLDADQDGFGAGVPIGPSCTQPQADTVVAGGPVDCDDGADLVFPGAAEICNGVDDDCDTLVDDTDPNVDVSLGSLFYRDSDGDGFGRDPGVRFCANPNPAQYAEQGGDCDDANGLGFPGASEVCDTVDNDCDLLVDEDDPSLDLATLIEHYQDLDEDGVGDSAFPIDACSPSRGVAPVAGDCDDLDATIGAPVLWQVDGDSDGVGAGATLGPASCAQPQADAVPQGAADDCLDTDPLIYPDAAEICGDAIDQDCDGGDLPCGPIGSFFIADGPPWMNNPPVFSCLDACAFFFGGVAADYQCSSSGMVIDNMAFVDGWGDGTGCTVPNRAEDFSLEQAGMPGYDCGFGGCSYSALVQDHCAANQGQNFCWPN
jgi:hypothetical protein